MTNQRQVVYNIMCRWEVIHREIPQDDFFDFMEDMAQSFYDCGHPHPDEITYETIEVNQVNGSSI